ncbi:MAG TPA: hypothetical protein VMW65_02080 [Chloroflexota bacterium]|nr:hypothetical protein [Chloroflexota bacterium]
MEGARRAGELSRSPNQSVEEMLSNLRTTCAKLALAQIWINPDCGPKTRRW